MKEKIIYFIKNASNNAIENHEHFEELALELWKWQILHNPEYGRFCGDIRPKSWKEIPAVPVALFRDVFLTSFPPMAATRVFRTSGTTGPRGKIHLLDTEVYDLCSIKGRELLIGSVPSNGGLSLVSASADSSLGHMCRLFAPQMLQCFSLDQGVLRDSAWDYLHQVKDPIFIPATAFSMASLVKDYQTPCLLPKGSIIMITGGFKGRHAELSEKELLDQLHFLFPTARMVGEYGMSELCSQLWSFELGGRFYPPPWLRALAVDPETGKETTNVGQLRFFDLANHQTVLAIETKDMGKVYPDGSVELLGRLPRADPRGCSLTVEEVDKLFSSQELPRSSSKKSKEFCSHQSKSKIEEVLKVLKELKNINPMPFSGGLSYENAQWGWQQALSTINKQGLEDILSTSTKRPEKISIVLAQGVFTSSLEWLSLSLASGASVHLKAPSAENELVEFLTTTFSEAGFDITCSTNRNIPPSDLLYAFGSDQTLQDIQHQTAHAEFKGYGHRFSVVICGESSSEAFRVSQDLLAYDGRGCMAPVGIFCVGNAEDFSEMLYQELLEAHQERPIGAIDPFLQPEIRRRIGLARIKGKVRLSPVGSVLTLPPRFFFPSSLPRIASVYPITSTDDAVRILEPWKNQLSSLSTSFYDERLREIFPRMVRLGKIQAPTFPRKHDGISMWLS